MQSKNVLFLGFGDLARRTAGRLSEHRLVGVARSAKAPMAGVEFWQGAAASDAVVQRLQKEAFDAVVLSLTPAAFTDLAYREAYVDTLQTLLPVWQAQPPGLVVFVSSTSVYHQNDGTWVDENSPTLPGGFAGRQLLAAENLLRKSSLPHCILRLAGIYGPGRDFLLRQVRAGKGGSEDFSNRIHIEDAAEFVAHLLKQHLAGASIEPCYVVCDSEPARGREVRQWLAQQIGVDAATLQPSISERGANKRCSNRRMLQTGFALTYSSYREGYGALLESGDIS